MNFAFNGVSVEELSFRLNRVKLEKQQLDIKPQFFRQVRRVNENDKILLISLAVKIESTQEEPKPFDLTVNVVGVFELESVPAAYEERMFVVEATGLLYPYLRAAVTNLTAQAYAVPLVLPVIAGPLFPEDRTTYSFPMDGDN